MTYKVFFKDNSPTKAWVYIGDNFQLNKVKWKIENYKVVYEFVCVQATCEKEALNKAKEIINNEK